MHPAKYRYIVVEGPIGVGKTSLTKKLADHLQADLLLENASDNPFLPRFYQDPKRYALATQLHFLFDRAKQISQLAQGDLFRHSIVSDFLLDKDRLFARLNLDNDEYTLYRKVFDDLALQAPTDKLKERVKRRGIDYEQGMNVDYLDRLTATYSEFFHHYTAAPVLMVNSDNLNFIKNTADFELLLERMEKMRGQREFFSRAA